MGGCSGYFTNGTKPVKADDIQVFGEEEDDSVKSSKTEWLNTLDCGVGHESTKATSGDLAWLNWIVDRLWPHANDAMLPVVKNIIEPKLQKSMPWALSGIHFDKFSLGTNPPVLGTVEVFSRKDADGHEAIELNVDVVWECNATISLKLPLVNIGLHSFSLTGTLCLKFDPLMRSLPIVGGLQLFMINTPAFAWDFAGAANIGDYPLVADKLREVLHEAIGDAIVLPNTLFVHWVQGREDEFNIIAKRFPKPEGMLRLCIEEAVDVDGLDWNFWNKRTSDCYAVVKLGRTMYRTPTRKKTTDPKWADTGCADYLVFNSRQLITLEMFDEDVRRGGAELIGRLQGVTIHDVLHFPDAWWPIYRKDKIHMGSLTSFMAGTEITHHSLHVCSAFYVAETSQAGVPEKNVTEEVNRLLRRNGPYDLLRGKSFEQVFGVSKHDMQLVITKLSQTFHFSASQQRCDLRKVFETCVAGRVRLTAKSFSFDAQLEAAPRPCPRGAANAVMLLAVEIRSLRGLTEKLSTGATIVATIEGKTYTTGESTFSAAEQDTLYDWEGELLTPAEQRLAEELHINQGVSAEEIARISGLHKASLERVLKQRPSFTTRWHQGFNVLLQKPESATINLELHVDKRYSKFKRLKKLGPARLRIPFHISELLKMEDHCWDGFLSIERQNACKRSPKSGVGELFDKVSGAVGDATREAAGKIKCVAQIPIQGQQWSTFNDTPQNAADDTADNIEDEDDDYASGLNVFSSKVDAEIPNSDKIKNLEALQGPFDIDVKFKLWGLRPLEGAVDRVIANIQKSPSKREPIRL